MIPSEEGVLLRGEVVTGKVMTSPFLRLGRLFDRVAIGAEQLLQCLQQSKRCTPPDFSVIDAIGGPPDAMRAAVGAVLQVLEQHRGVIRCLDLRGCNKEEQLQQIWEAIQANEELAVEAVKLELNVSTMKQVAGLEQALQHTKTRYLALHRVPGRSSILPGVLASIRTTCHMLVLKDCAITAEDMDALIQFVSEVDSLQHLTLSQVATRPKQRLLEAVACAVRKPNMRSLDLSNNRLSSQDVASIAWDILQVASQQPLGIKSLYLDKNAMSGTAGYLELGYICRTLIPRMSLEQCRMSDESFADFVNGLWGQRGEDWSEVIEHHQEALELNLSANMITWAEDSCHLLDNELRIKTLLLNHIAGVATAGLSASLRTNSYLERLELENSGMRGPQCQELVIMLEGCWRDAEHYQFSPPLRFLNLNGTGLGYQGASSLALLIRNRRHPLQYISIAQCHIGEIGQRAMTEALAEDDRIVWLDMSADHTLPFPAPKVFGTAPAKLETKLALLGVNARRRQAGRQALSPDVLQVVFSFLRVPVRRHVQ